ncbi:hypothetical protein EVAR_28717_1 [Eumeta japonica]|uniref:Uncharacterized protein n=1 Tax=Eumeta variegata TaxID=151549 RepID=A0A4C1V5L5_EUMVA|nr:hypothetical protein EVAR_28717_1 [Eumeta japonica]
MRRLVDVSEAREMCKDRTKWKSTVSAYPSGKYEKNQPQVHVECYQLTDDLRFDMRSSVPRYEGDKDLHFMKNNADRDGGARAIKTVRNKNRSHEEDRCRPPYSPGTMT